jgi:hypothetical protein
MQSTERRWQALKYALAAALGLAFGILLSLVVSLSHSHDNLPTQATAPAPTFLPRPYQPPAQRPVPATEEGAWHSVHSNVYHTCPECHAANRIHPDNRKEGIDGRRLCKICERLIRKGECSE